MSTEGVPEGWRLVRIGKPVEGECYLDDQGDICTAYEDLRWIFPIICREKKNSLGRLADGVRGSEDIPQGAVSRSLLEWQDYVGFG